MLALKIPLEAVQAYRTKTFRMLAQDHLRSKEDAVEFANTRGFVYFWPIRDVLMPSLWAAAAGDRPVADEHNDPGHVTWGWKDELLGKKQWYYAKVLRKKATIISLDVLPYFYALSENYGSPEEDYLTLYQQGRSTLESKIVFETLLKEGPLDTIELRKAAHMSSRDSDSRFNRALSDLQANFQILPTGITQSGRWHYAHLYDLTIRHIPDLIDQTRFIDDRKAQQTLAELYLRSIGAAQPRDFIRLFGWSADVVSRTINSLVEKGTAVRVELEDTSGDFIAINELIQ
ncbi:MAG: hypothetical protein EHM41_03870 [Chloroflexi bacterium]|nr:MAG: hypothetical protein EHM41_03870 [Chloroflexota bacterium]